MPSKKRPAEIFVTMADIRLVAKRFGGRVERDGVGGFEVIAPDGHRWKDAEVSCYPIPLSEAESTEEKREMIETAGRMLIGGIEEEKR